MASPYDPTPQHDATRASVHFGPRSLEPTSRDSSREVSAKASAKACEREEWVPKLHCTLLEPSLEASRTQAVASDVEVPKALNAQGFFSQGLQGAKDKASFLASAESMAL